MTWGWQAWPVPLKFAALGVTAFALWLVANRIYDAGYGRGEAQGRAALETLKREYSDKAAERWAEYAQKLQAARAETQDAQDRANALESDLLKTKTALAAERRGFAKRITDATSNADCRLSPDVVRLYNEALYGPGHAALGGREDGPAGAAGAAKPAPSPAAFGAGILRQQPVTMRDLLAHAKLYGEWAREVHAIAQGWITLSRD